MLTREFLLARGKCCELGCRNCPWRFRLNFEEIIASDVKLSQNMSLIGNGGLTELEAVKACVCELAKRLDRVVVACEMLGDPLGKVVEIKKIAKGA